MSDPAGRLLLLVIPRHESNLNFKLKLHSAGTGTVTAPGPGPVNGHSSWHRLRMFKRAPAAFCSCLSLPAAFSVVAEDSSFTPCSVYLWLAGNYDGNRDSELISSELYSAAWPSRAQSAQSG